MEDDDEPP